VFLTMGVQLKEVVENVERDHAGVGAAVLVALGALALTVVVRAVYVAFLLRSLRERAARTTRMQPRLLEMQEKMATPEGQQETLERMNARGPRRRTLRDLDRFAVRITRGLADVDYFLRAPLGWREGTAVVWAGMRGAVTVAAAQTLPDDTPQRSVLVLVAYTVAALSLLVQGGTIGPLLRRLAPPVDEAAVAERADAERTRLFEILRSSSADVEEPEVHERQPRPEQFEARKRYRLEVIAAQRAALLDARDNGTFDADLLEDALSNLDADEIAIDLRGRLAG